MQKQRKCVNHPDNFCYVCGRFTTKTQRNKIYSITKTAYHLYFGCKIGDLDKAWAPHICCITCTSNLRQWLHGVRNSMPFAVPMIWREPRNHIDDCYFCMTKIAGMSKKSKHSIVYPNIPSAIRPVPHSENLPVPVLPKSWKEIPSEESTEESCEEQADEDYQQEMSNKPHLIKQEELSDLIRDLNLPKDQAEILGSRLQQWNLLDSGTKITIYRKRHEEYSKYFSVEGGMCFCTNVDGLMKELGFEHNPHEWRVFIDASKISLKAVLLHNGNKIPSIPLLHVVGVKETYESMAKMLEVVKYQDYAWKVCADLKVVALLTGLQGGFTKYCCFLCLWDSRAREKHYVVREWEKRMEFIPGQRNVKHNPLVEPKNVLLPPLHIKLGLMKNFVKALDPEGSGFAYLRGVFPRLTEAKLKEGIFIGPQIRKLLKDDKFEKHLKDKELAAWRSFKAVVHGFLGNKKEENYVDLVENLLRCYKEMAAECH